MVASIEWLRLFISHYHYLEYFAVFLGAAFGGELALFAFGFLAAHNVISIYFFIIFGFLGTLSSDSLWFFLGRTDLVKKIVTHRYAHSTIAVIDKAVNRVSRGNNLTALIIAKFLIGTRALFIMHFSTKAIHFKKFIHYDSIAILSWFAVIIPIGFLSGLGFVYFSSIVKNVYIAVGFILLIIFIAILLEIWLEKKFTHMDD